MKHPFLRATLSLTLLAAAPCALAQSPAPTTPAPAAAATPTTPLADQITTLLAAPAVARDHWGIQVTTLDGAPLYSLNEAQLFQPASNAKLFTTAAALALLGPDIRFKTRIEIDSTIGANGVLHGDLSLVGGGDANFGSNDIPYLAPRDRPKTTVNPQDAIADIEELADQIVTKGIRKIDGNIIGDDSSLPWNPYPSDWSWDDLLWGYGAPVSGLTVHNNQVTISPLPASLKSAPGLVNVAPDIPYYNVVNRTGPQDEGKRDCDAIIYSRQLGSKEIHVDGDSPIGTAHCTEQIAIQDPAEYAAMALKLALIRRGVQVTGSARSLHSFLPDASISNFPDSEVAERLANPNSKLPRFTVITIDGPQPIEIARRESPTLAEDIVLTNKVSQNLHAELMLRNIGELVSGQGSLKVSLHIERQFLLHAGLAPNDFIFYDGSGLSSHDLVTPRATARLLSYAAHDPTTGQPQSWFALWKSSLPIGGEDGTLESRFAKPPLKDHLFAKTGTLGEARALSGYLDAASGRTIIFSIMVGNHLPGTSDDREAMDKIVAAIQSAE